jgi:probable rRNA maturation factor
MAKINFIVEDVDIRFFKNKGKVKIWIKEVLASHKAKPIEINYIFCSDEYLLKVNKEYLDHDYYTDIITFDNSEKPGEIESDIFVSVDRIKDNAQAHNETFEREFHRVLIHGILHLVGYKDKTDEDEASMRIKENECLAILEL